MPQGRNPEPCNQWLPVIMITAVVYDAVSLFGLHKYDNSPMANAVLPLQPFFLSFKVSQSQINDEDSYTCKLKLSKYSIFWKKMVIPRWDKIVWSSLPPSVPGLKLSICLRVLESLAQQ